MSKKLSKFLLGVLLIILSSTFYSCSSPQAKYFSVFYYVDGENVTQIEVRGKEPLISPIPTKEGYDFDGWYKDNGTWNDEFKDAYLTKTGLTKDLKVYAKFSLTPAPPRYTITFVNEGGDDIAPIEGEAGENFAYPNMIEREEYEFHGWYFDDETFKNLFDTGMIPAEDITVYANWFYIQDITKVFYTVTFDGDGGTLISGEAVQQVKHGENAVPPIYEKTGYTLVDTDGWSGSTYGITEDTTITAIWEINSYIITFDGNGGVFTDNYATYWTAYEYGALIVEPQDLYKAFFEVESWKIEGDSENFVFGEMPAKDITLIANWVEKTATAGLTYKLLDDDSYVVSGLGTATDKDIVIPSVYNDKRVTAIGVGAFAREVNNNDEPYILAIKMPDTITSIGENAFDNRFHLTTIIMSNNVTSIGESAFANIAFINELILSSNLESIGKNAFMGCVGLSEITLPDGLISIGDSAFHGCQLLTEIIIPDSVTTLGANAFMGCLGLITVTISSEVEMIPEFLFSVCTNLETIYINAVIPPELEVSAFNDLSDFMIYVPADSHEAYKAATGWSAFEDKIFAQ